MNIQPINTYAPAFNANLNSAKLKFRRKDFYVNIKGYGENQGWADVMIKTADTTVKLIRKNTLFEKILQHIAGGVLRANRKTEDLGKYMHTGILRGKREGWMPATDWSKFELWTNYGMYGLPKYRSYEDRLDFVYSHPLKNPYSDIELTRPFRQKDKKYLKHGDDKFVNGALNHIAGIYKDFSKYIGKDVQESDLKNINDDIAEIRWILAHATPWERGSDSISNVLIRAMYKALGIKTSPLAKGVSLDMEAYCTDLAEYKRKFTSYFERPPKIAD